MASNPKKPGSEGNKSKMIPIRACLRLFLKHPVRVIVLMFMIYIHRSFPSAFLLFISASPVIICAVVLLVALLALGQKHAQRAEEDALKGFKYPSPISHDSSQADSAATPEGRAGGSGASSSVGGGGSGGGGGFKDKFAELRKDIVEKEMKESRFLESNSSNNNNNQDNNNVGMMRGSKGKVDHLMFAYNEKFPKVGLGKELNAENIRGKLKVMNKERTDEITDMSSSLSYSSSSDSDLDSDHAPHKSSSRRDSIPSKLCDYHPLLGPEDRQVHEDHSDDLDSSSTDSEDKQHLEGDKVKKEAIKSMVRWTEEDKKNVENLGNLELERNKQLENIIAKRKAQKNSLNEENLIDLQNINIPSQAAPITTMKTNPFNVSYPISHQQSDLPPMPDSASFFPRRNPNPFEDPDNPDKPDSVETTQDGVEFLNRHPSLQTKHKDQQDHEVNQREALFRRYQSFGVVGSSFYGFLWQQGNEASSDPSRPYFVPQQAPVGENLTIEKNPSLSSDSSESSSNGMHDHVLAAVYSSSDHGEPVSDSSTEINDDDHHQHEMRKRNVDRSSSSSSASSESEEDDKPKKRASEK